MFYRVRREKILQSLLWLQRNNRFYRDVEIDFEGISNLPTCGIPSDIVTLISDDSDTSTPATNDDIMDTEPAATELSDDDNISSSFMSRPENVQREEEAIRASIAGQDAIDWPSHGERPLNEFDTEGLVSQVTASSRGV